MNRTGLVAAAVLAMVLGAVISIIMNHGDKLPEKPSEPDVTAVTGFQGYPVTPARNLLIPTLTKDNGKPFTLSDLTGHWSLMFFGYTHCPDVCPTTLNMLGQAKHKLGDNGFPKVFFITIDPQRDTLDVIGDYVHYFDKAFVGVTGEDKMIKALTTQASVVYFKVPQEGSNDYQMDHSSSLLLVNPEGKLAAFINPPITANAIVAALKKMAAVGS